MNLRRPVASMMLLLLVAVPVSSADDLRAGSAQVSDIDTGHGGLVALQWADPTGPGFVLTAQSLRIETDERALVVDSVWTEATTSHTDHTDAVVTGTAARAEQARATVLPLEARYETEDISCARMDAPVAGRFTFDPVLQGRPADERSLEAAVAWSPCAETKARIVGDFVLALWEWDAEVRTDDGTAALPSGQGPAASGDTAARERFLVARNATLVLPASAPAVYLSDPVVAARAVHLTDADGVLHGTPVTGDLDLVGDLTLLVAGNGPDAPLTATVAGDVARTFLDDATVQATDARGLGAWPWLALAAVAALLVYLRFRPHLVYWHAERTDGELGTLVPQTMRQRRGVGLWILARAAERRNRFRLSHRRAGRANDLFRPFPEAQFTRAVAAGHLGLHADAMTDFLDLYNRHDEPAGRAAAACGVAQECCRLKKWDAAREWLERAAFESPEYARVAVVDPGFDHFAGQPWFESLRAGRGTRASGPVGGPDPSFH